MAQGQKLRGALTRDPGYHNLPGKPGTQRTDVKPSPRPEGNMANVAMERLSPGVYRSAGGGLVNRSGNPLPGSRPPSPQPQPATPIQGWNPSMNDAARMGKGPAMVQQPYQPIFSQQPMPNYGGNFGASLGGQYPFNNPQFQMPMDNNFVRYPAVMPNNIDMNQIGNAFVQGANPSQMRDAGPQGFNPQLQQVTQAANQAMGPNPYMPYQYK